MLDKSQMNPEAIAWKLYKAGCPFDCDYRSYSVSTLLERHEQSLDENVVRLVFELNNDDYSVSGKDLDYSLDMLASDIGTFFGILLGLSMIDLFLYLTHFSRAFVYDTLEMFKMIVVHCCKKSQRKQAKSPGGKMMLAWFWNLYSSAKWTTVTAIIGYIVVASFSGDFKHLLLNNVFSEDISATNLTLFDDVEYGFTPVKGFLKKSNKSATCPHENEIGDGFCDDKANTPQCQFDLEDCCKPRKLSKPNAHEFCSNCTCIDQNTNDTNRINARMLKPGRRLKSHHLLKVIFVTM